MKKITKFWVTGGAGFIGSRLIKHLNDEDITNVILIDDINKKNFHNVKNLQIDDLISIKEFKERVYRKLGTTNKNDIVLHFGACSSTQSSVDEVMENNFEFSKAMFKWAERSKFYFASSAGVYGKEAWDANENQNPSPLTPYAFSKAVFDQWVEKQRTHEHWCGFRIFNCWGPGEESKELNQINPFYRHYINLKSGDFIKVLTGPDGLGNDAITHARDFIYIDDAIKIMWFLIQGEHRGFFNVGTGKTETFENIGKLVNNSEFNLNKKQIVFSTLDSKLKSKIQPYSKANIDKIRKLGFKERFLTTEQAWDKFRLYLKEDNK